MLGYYAHAANHHAIALIIDPGLCIQTAPMGALSIRMCKFSRAYGAR
jgi:hypothetical protein